MKIPLIALLAISTASALCAANWNTPQLAIYYSFDTSPPAVLVTEMQTELSQILSDSGLRVTWRALESPRDGSEDFRAIAVVRFHGTCSFSQNAGDNEREPDPAGKPLAETELVEGRVLPFGGVDCNTLRRFIAPKLNAEDAGRKDADLGRAIARVTAHEIYHMLSGSELHAKSGIARSSHSSAELTAPTFTFAQTETNWLRAWALNGMGQPMGAAEARTESAREPDSLILESSDSVSGR